MTEQNEKMAIIGNENTIKTCLYIRSEVLQATREFTTSKISMTIFGYLEERGNLKSLDQKHNLFSKSEEFEEIFDNLENRRYHNIKENNIKGLRSSIVELIYDEVYKSHLINKEDEDDKFKKYREKLISYTESSIDSGLFTTQDGIKHYTKEIENFWKIKEHELMNDYCDVLEIKRKLDDDETFSEDEKDEMMKKMRFIFG